MKVKVTGWPKRKSKNEIIELAIRTTKKAVRFVTNAGSMFAKPTGPFLVKILKGNDHDIEDLQKEGILVEKIPEQ